MSSNAQTYYQDLPETPPGDEGADTPSDENLHFGRAWHRYRYCYRRADGLRVLDAGCGAGLASLDAARLNPGATVLGVDASPNAVGQARRRAALAGTSGVSFEVHDPSEPFPTAWGRFDFVICRGVLGRALEPAQVLTRLAGALAPGGLMLVSMPSRGGRPAARALRRAIDTLAPPDAPMADRVNLGLDLARSLRPEHPIHDRPADSAPADPTALVFDALSEGHDWSLPAAEALLEDAGLALLYAATPWPWRGDRVFQSDTPEGLTGALGRLDPAPLSRLVDALDPTALGPEYVLYARRTSETPDVPDWTRIPGGAPEEIDGLVPHRTGLASVAEPRREGRTAVRFISGAFGEIDRVAEARLALVDGRTTCGEIDRSLVASTRACDDAKSLRRCWRNLADNGIILLEPTAAPAVRD